LVNLKDIITITDVFKSLNFGRHLIPNWTTLVMRRQFLLAAFILGTSIVALSQSTEKIDNSNYYQFFKDGVSINWLRASDAVPIIIDELLKNGIPYHTINVGDLVKVNDTTRLVSTVSYGREKKYSFLYEASHSIPLDPKDRNYLMNLKNVAYVQAETDLNGDVSFMRIEPLPQNVFLLRQRVYWFQFDSNGSKFPVSKEVAQSILRQDIREYIKKAR
jgi:uncharacterized protein YerC